MQLAQSTDQATIYRPGFRYGYFIEVTEADPGNGNIVLAGSSAPLQTLANAVAISYPLRLVERVYTFRVTNKTRHARALNPVLAENYVSFGPI
jgi:hypothetical protein